VDSSKSPPSDFAAEVGRFAEDSLEEVLDGNVSPACSIESKTPDNGGQVSSGNSNVPAAPSSTLSPLPAPTAVSVSPTGMVGNINDDLKPALGKALGVDLIVQSFFQSSAGGGDTATISYVVAGQLPAGVDLSAALSNVVAGLGALFPLPSPGPKVRLWFSRVSRPENLLSEVG
jgi:hypothetical protein